MSAHCHDSLSYPRSGYLPNMDFEASVKPCRLTQGVIATHTTKLNNQRTGDVHKIQICVKPKNKGVVLQGDPTLTEHIHNDALLKSGGNQSYKCSVTRNNNNLMSNDQIETSVTLYDSTQVSGNTYGSTEGAAIRFTVDIP